MVKKVHKHGFSLLELVVVVGIMMTVTGFIITNYNSYNQVERVRQAGKTLRNNLRFIQTRATSGVKPAGCATLVGYAVSFTETTYTYQASCTNGLSGSSQVITLPEGVSFSSIPATLLFRVLTGTTDTQASLSVTGFSRTYIISVSRSGDITDQGMQ